MTSFLGGHVVAVFGTSDDLTRYKDKVRVLGFATGDRFPGFPDARTLKEQGFDMVEGVDRGIAVPPNTPADVIKTLESAFMALALASIARGVWLQVRSHAPEIAIDDADE